MRLLIIGPRVVDIWKARNFSGVWAYYLAREFEKHEIELRYDAQLKLRDLPIDHVVQHYRDIDLAGVDHVLALGIGYLDRIPAECIRDLKKRCAGLVAQTHDRASIYSEVDITFGIRNEPEATDYQCIGWAADQELCKPRQSGPCQILIDHPDYGSRDTDQTAKITASALKFANGRNVTVRRIGDGGIRDCGRTVPTYTRGHRPYVEMCAEYGRANIFMVTHPESVGLTALECAMAGALVVSPTSFIAPELLSTIRHIAYDGAPPWPTIMRELDIKASRDMAVKNRWSDVADKMLMRLPC